MAGTSGCKEAGFRYEWLTDSTLCGVMEWCYQVGKLRPSFYDTIGQYLPNGTNDGVCKGMAENSECKRTARNAIICNKLWSNVVPEPDFIARSGTAIAPYEFRPRKLPSGGRTVGNEKLNGRVSRSASNVPGPEMGRLCVGRIRVRGGSALFLCANANGAGGWAFRVYFVAFIDGATEGDSARLEADTSGRTGAGGSVSVSFSISLSHAFSF